MLRKEAYEMFAYEFGTDIAVAEWDGSVYPQYERIKDIPDEMKCIVLILYTIRENLYKESQIELYKLEKQYQNNKRIKKSSIYEKAINRALEKKRGLVDTI